jgi:membrane protease YdiL (CAAX protease family)
MERATKTALAIPVAFVLWIFVFLTVFLANFWLRLALATAILLILATVINGGLKVGPGETKLVVLGFVSGILLYLFFFAGYVIVVRNNPVLGSGVSSVYGLKSSSPVTLVFLLLLFPIGPAEEIFWRGLVQRNLTTKLGPNWSYLFSSGTYMAIHAATANITLMLTALIAGLVWGFLFLKTKSLVAPIISHVVWDELIFVLLPLG